MFSWIIFFSWFISFLNNVQHSLCILIKYEMIFITKICVVLESWICITSKIWVVFICVFKRCRNKFLKSNSYKDDPNKTFKLPTFNTLIKSEIATPRRNVLSSTHITGLVLVIEVCIRIENMVSRFWLWEPAFGLSCISYQWPIAESKILEKNWE